MSPKPHNIYLLPQEIPYRHIEPIGHGAQASVDSVEKGGELYARKTFTLSRTPKPIELERVLREIKIANGLLHKHIVRLVETYQRKNTYAIILDPVAEGNLGTYLGDLDDSPAYQHFKRREQLAPWFRCLAKAVAFCHERGVHHRDIKPHNILTLRGNVLFTDFGISEEFEEKTMTGSTEIIGTKTYRSPEREAGLRSGRREDVFSLGAVFLEMLTVYSGPGKLTKFRTFRKGPYCQNLPRIEQWAGLLLEVGFTPFWYPAMVCLCGFMLERSRVNRPYANDLSSFWSCPAIINGYKTSWLPVSECCCDLPPIDRKREDCRTWKEAVRVVSTTGDWSPELKVIERWVTATENWYGRWAAAAGLHTGEDVIPSRFGTNLAGVTLWLHWKSRNEIEKLESRNKIEELIQYVSFTNLKDTVHRILAILKQPKTHLSAETSVETIRDTIRHTTCHTIDFIIHTVCSSADDVEPYANLCVDVLYSLPVEIADVVSKDKSDSATLFRFGVSLRDRCLHVFQNLMDLEAARTPTDFTEQQLRLTRFICELYDFCPLSSSPDTGCMPDRKGFTREFIIQPLQRLLEFDSLPHARQIEAFVFMLITAARDIERYDGPLGNGSSMLTSWFETIEKARAMEGLSTRSHALLVHLIELQASGWKPETLSCPVFGCTQVFVYDRERVGPWGSDIRLNHILWDHKSE
jgi:serine/threonine protein kinase